MTLGTSFSPLHFYDVSLVDGFNLPVSMKPVGGGIGCGMAACEVDLNLCCPSALEVKRGGKVVGCKSACLAMQSAKYCCTGEYANPKTCKPTLFAHLFKAICPKAYSYAFDDSTSLNKCRASRYVITFCPPTWDMVRQGWIWWIISNFYFLLFGSLCCFPSSGRHVLFDFPFKVMLSFDVRWDLVV